MTNESPDAGALGDPRAVMPARLASGAFRPPVRNRLLASLSADDLAILTPHLKSVPLVLRTKLFEAWQPVDHVYFPETGLVSMIARAGAESIEVGIIGVDGVAGISVALGVDVSPVDALVQVAGTALRMPVEPFRAALRERPGIATLMGRAAHLLLVQTEQTALANGRQTVEQRLARWLLMAHDRLDSDEVGLTHEFLAFMLGVRRPGVTVALHLLEGNGAIRSKRNAITILDRAKLRSIAGPTYGAAETLFETLTGTPLKRE